MINRIHITGSYGSGTTTLGQAMEEKIGYKHLDSDNYFWLPTNPSFQKKREREERRILLQSDFEKYDKWVLTGWIEGWGDVFIPNFDLVVFLWVPTEIRVQRITERESKRLGDSIKSGGQNHEQFASFIDLAARYDYASIDVGFRSKALQEEWMSRLSCPIVRIEGDISVEERVEIVKRKVEELR